jgi:hypothetical protein
MNRETVACKERTRIARRSSAAVGTFVLFGALSTVVRASDDPAKDANAQSQTQRAPARESPWLLLPTFSSNPKLGTALGVMAGYAARLDPESQVSIFALSAKYTSTDSDTASAIGRASFGADHHRIAAGAIGGTIKNDYDDFQGTGEPLKSEDDFHVLFGRYLYRLTGDWFVGAQFVVTDYQLVGETAMDEDLLNTLGLDGFDSAGVGLSIYHDSRDIQDAPSRGWMLNGNNIAYREALSGEFDFDVYRLEYRGFWSHGKGHVFAVRQNNQWTVDAPPSAYAPIKLRGYTAGEYLGQNMSSIEIEERHRIAPRWTATFFAGAACLYGDGLSCSDSDNVYPTVGVGVQFLFKPAKGLVANLEYAQGKSGNNAVLFKLGYGW